MSTILVADAEPQIRRIIGRLLNAEGHACVFADSGEDALRIVRENRPGLVLIDVEMPVRSGLEVLAALRRDKEACATRVILTCAGARLAAADAERVASADDFVAKPFEPNQLVERVRAALLSVTARGVNLAQRPNLTEPVSPSAREGAVVRNSDRGRTRS